MEEVFFYIPNPGFDAPFFVWLSHITGARFKAVVCGKVEVSRVKERLFSAGMLQHSRLWVVDEYFGWNTAKNLEGVLMSLQEVFGRLTQAELDVAHATVAKHHDKEGESSPGEADDHRSGTSPINLSAFARSKSQSEESWRTHPADRTHIVGEDGNAAGVAFLGTEPLEDLSGSVGMPLQPALDEDFVGVQLTFSLHVTTRYRVTLRTSPFGHRLFIEVQLPSDLGKV